MSVPAATAGTTALGGVRICRAGSLITGQQVPDFPHGHIRDVLRGDLGKQLPQSQIGPVAPAGHPVLPGLGGLTRVGYIAVGRTAARRGGLNLRQHPPALALVDPRHGIGQGTVLGQQRRHRLATQDLLNGSGIVQKPDVQVIRQCLPAWLYPFAETTWSNRLTYSSREGLMSTLI